MQEEQMDSRESGNDGTGRGNDGTEPGIGKASPATTIAHVHAREVLDSRGVPTVEVDVTLAGGARGRAIVPSGASTGRHEALEFRDGNPARYQGKGVRHAVRHVNEVLGPAVVGVEATRQHEVDSVLVASDGTPNLRRLGGNAVLGVSLAAAHAAAESLGLPLYRYLGGSLARELPVPMVNILSGGLHARGVVDFQDFLLIPIGAHSFSDALVMVRNVYHAMYELLTARGASTLVADEGGLTPPVGAGEPTGGGLPANEAAVQLLVRAIERAGYRPGEDAAIGLDVAATHFYHEGKYHLSAENRILSSAEMVDLLARWVEAYPIISIEDGLAEDDWSGWQALTTRVGGRAQLIGDDLFVTNVQRLQQGIETNAANAVLVKVNQVGTLTAAMATLRLARTHGYLPVVSARSGETEDATIADLAVGMNAGQIKIGSITRSERLAKYNQLLRIEEELWPHGVYRGREVFRRFLGAPLLLPS
ncbi:MAG: phosphopyruvate hydratase [Chloroflexi bacterium]|nr:phosphopyruvate hydratase [Chloroflexota bacterium]